MIVTGLTGLYLWQSHAGQWIIKSVGGGGQALISGKFCELRERIGAGSSPWNILWIGFKFLVKRGMFFCRYCRRSIGRFPSYSVVLAIVLLHLIPTLPTWVLRSSAAAPISIDHRPAPHCGDMHGHVVALLLLCYLFPFLSYCRPYLKLACIVITNQISFHSLAAV